VDAVIAWQYPAANYGWAPTGMEASFDFKENAEKSIADAISNAVDPGSDIPMRPVVVIRGTTMTDR
jgi:hypothetical protein